MTVKRFVAIVLCATLTAHFLASSKPNHVAAQSPVTDAASSEHTDPFGTVFDSQSLEPLPDISVTLLDANKNIVSVPGSPNPTITNADGAFSFMVEPGVYYLTITSPTGYAFEAQPFIHPNYAKAYANIYKPDDPIVVSAGIPEHRDIPLNPGVNLPYRTQPVPIFTDIIQNGASTKISGKQSHPLTAISVRQMEKDIKKTTADRFGYYELEIKNTDITGDKRLNIAFIKNNLSAVEPTPEASRTALQLDIPLPYLEGMAVDTRGTPIPNARVRVKLKMSDTIYYETDSDARGVFIASPENLPQKAYYLEFSPPTSLSTIKMTTTEFATHNAEYLTANKINLMTATKNGRSLFEKKADTQPANTKKDSVSQAFPTVIPSFTPTPAPQQKPTSAISLVTLAPILLGVFISLSGLFLFMIKRRRSSMLLPDESEEMPGTMN